MSTSVAASWLFVPGSQPDRFAKAATAGATEVIVDLEDAVAPHEKDGARTHACDWLSRQNFAWVRINGARSPHHRADVEAVAATAGLLGIVLPKVEDVAAIDELAQRVPELPIVALIETALGVQSANRIATASTVVRLAFGSIDFSMDIGIDGGDEALLVARSSLVMASRARGLPPPIDGVTSNFGDDDQVRADALRSRRLGFGGKLCVHPREVAIVNKCFEPTAAEVAWATNVLHAASQVNDSAFAFRGQLVDVPVLQRARRILASYKQASEPIDG